VDEQVLIYELRRLADARRQPSQKAVIDDLHSALLNLSPPRLHPYSLTRDDYATLKHRTAYSAVCQGSRGIMATDYCYRLTTWAKILLDMLDIDWRLIPGDLSEREAFDYLIHQHAATGTWISLSDFIGGTYSGRRQFTWWTTASMPSANTICTAHQLGLLNDYIGTEAVVLRCSVDYLLSTMRCFVPSVVDAYFLNIFHATRDEDLPKSGRAISVEIPAFLELGQEEFVVRPIEIDSARIELWPLPLNDPTEHKVYFHDVQGALVKYYGSLAE
jgi:hypothetical protein